MRPHPAHAVPSARECADIERVVVVILAGGNGSRLWPLSTRERPKQFAALLHASSTMLQLTWDRVLPGVPAERVLVNVARGFEALACHQLPDLDPRNLIVAPQERNTLPIAGYATLCIEERFPGSTIVMLASDNHVGDLPAFHAALLECCLAAQSGPFVVALGVRPRHASTQYGYMTLGERAAFGRAAHHGLGYVEKPELATAERLLAEGRHDWNTGVFAWTADTFLHACRLHAPQHYAVFERLRGQLDCLPHNEIAHLFTLLPRQDIDRGVMEHLCGQNAEQSAPQLMLVRGDFDWDDLGDFSALARRWPRDPSGNSVRGSVLVEDCQRCTLACEQPFELEARGLTNMLVAVNARGDLALCPRSEAHKVAALAQQPLFSGLKRNGDGRLVPSDSCGGSQVEAFARLSDADGNLVCSDGNGVIAVHGVHGYRIEVSGQRAAVARHARHDIEPSAETADALSWVLVDDDHESLSRRAAEAFVAHLRVLLAERDHPVVVASAGRTPVRTYELLREHHRDAIAWQRLRFFQMDEYVPRLAEDAATFRRFLDASLVSPLGMTAAWLDGYETPQALQDHEAQIDKLGGIDLVLHGIGVNGHLGFNEPGSAFDCSARRVRLASTTRPPAMPLQSRPTEGVTLGLRQLSAARRVMLVASGQAKRQAIRDALLSPSDPSCPASSLQAHPNVSIYLDRAACSWLGAADG